MLFSKFIIEEYKGDSLFLLSLYPVSRRKVFFSKIILCMALTLLFSITSQFFVYLIFMLTESITPHSFGTYVGLKAIQTYPELYSAYVGISQITNVRESERRIYLDLLRICKEKKDVNGESLLKKNANNAKQLSNYYMKNVKGKLLKRYQLGLTRKQLPNYFLIQKIISFPLYNLKNKLDYCKGLMYSSKSLFPMVKDINLFQNSCDFKIPIYFIHGHYDYQISVALVNEFFKRIQSPKKELIIFEESAHFPNIEEPDKFNEIINLLCGGCHEAKK